MSLQMHDRLLWPEGRRKAFTVSYDDGVTQDIRLIELLNRYGIKGTFNLNSGLLGQSGMINVGKKPATIIRFALKRSRASMLVTKLHLMGYITLRFAILIRLDA